MTPERWARIKEVFNSAQEKPETERDAFLDDACGSDTALRQEVQRLLGEQGASDLESPVAGVLRQATAPSLAAGSMLGHYRVEEKVGEGGMGAVYRAYDTQLRRPVALKVLPPEYTSDPERRERLLREARAASALSHPNIIGIYEVGSDAGMSFIAMEFIEGKSLERVIPAKGLPLGQALDYAVQIASGLTKAHASGVIHRDLKPGNIMVTRDGLVKLLDFGLARRVEVGDAHDTNLTVEGEILGTPSYMSPEQAEGKRVDVRSDIFTFGAVLYEMVTGRRAFQRDSQASTLAAIITLEPAPLADDLPRDLEKVITRCLRKDVDRRFQHMDDVKIALQELKEESDSGKLAPLSAPLRQRRSVVPALAIVLVLLAAGAVATWWFTRSPKSQELPVITRLTSDAGLTMDPALSPDGKLLAYASDRGGNGSLDIWVQQLAGGDPMRLTRDEADEIEPSFSPDGSKIAYRCDRKGGGIYVISVLGGEPRLVAKSGRQPRFSPDGDWIAYSVGDDQVGGLSRMYIAPSAGGPSRQLQPEFRGARFPVWSPDGKRLLFFGTRDRTTPLVPRYDWWVAPVDGGTAVKTGAGGVLRRHGLTFQTDNSAIVPRDWLGDEVFFSATMGDSTNLWQIAISPKTWQITSAPRRLTLGSGLEVHPSVALGPAGTASGQRRVVFASLASTVDLWCLPIDANRGKVLGELQRLTQDAAVDTFPSLSPDGKKLLFVSSRSGNEDVWVKDLITGGERPLTDTRSIGVAYPTLSGDGSKVAYIAREKGRLPIYVVATAGGVPEKVCEGCGLPYSWSSDGRNLLSFASGPFGVQLIDVASGKRTQLLRHPKYDLLAPRFSPDDRWVAFHARNAPLTRRIFVAPSRPGEAVAESEWIAITDGLELDRDPHWSPDGSLLYFHSHRDGFRCIWAQRLDTTTKRPVGSAFPVYHFHRARLASRVAETGRMGLSIAGGKIALSLEELTGNIWLAKLPAPEALPAGGPSNR